MNLLDQVRGLLIANKPRRQGKVVREVNGLYDIATSKGIVRVSSGIATTLNVDDTVSIKGGIITGKLTNRDSVKKYIL